jgi:predicted nucleic acid-binding protein
MSADLAYIDTSAAVKLVIREKQTTALRRELGRWPRRASSALLRLELLRAVARTGLPRAMDRARRELATVHLVTIDEALLDRAIDLRPSRLRSLDSLHLATALTLGADLGAVVTYDARMIGAASGLGLPVVSPG